MPSEVRHEVAGGQTYPVVRLTGVLDAVTAPTVRSWWAGRKRSPSVAKYANPANKADTWSGRGRKPRWFSEALAKGKKPEDLAV